MQKIGRKKSTVNLGITESVLKEIKGGLQNVDLEINFYGCINPFTPPTGANIRIEYLAIPHI